MSVAYKSPPTKLLDLGILGDDIVYDVRTAAIASFQAVAITGSWSTAVVTLYASQDGWTLGTAIGTITASGGDVRGLDETKDGYIIARVTTALGSSVLARLTASLKASE